MTNTESVQTWLLLLNFDRICNLPTNIVWTIALVDEIVELERGGPEPLPSSFLLQEEQLDPRERELSAAIIEALRARLRQRMDGAPPKTSSPLDAMLQMRLPDSGATLDHELNKLLNVVCASVEVSASIVPVNDFDRQFVQEMISANFAAD